ncbi:hypothetical protein FOMPIDRAFT_1048399 [Fomitopsis schrenkii]|uniref:SET domain-containing protein n=1 Tax=Fomitopsis schrenkii TaxID=2126942 RepID=S8EF50_FOMSC|nr:hypothetical protein FOMPIDRAFT_1048399 [Fomitopsis schrenkii]
MLADKISLAPYGLGAQLALSVALSCELEQGEASRWYGYLQSLPSETVPIALLWGDRDALGSDPDGEDARAWITGTEIDRTLRGEDNQDPMNEIRGYYHSIAAHLLPASCTISHFLRAYSLVSSRAFMVDAYHGLSMVPIADAFNHITENHIHLECDFDVCPLCGSFAECTHDREDAPPASEEPMDWQSPSIPAVPDTCDMVVNRRILACCEVFNTYGARKSNASLLAWYGFALDGNENDVIGWDLSDVAQALGGATPSFALPSEESYKAVLRAWLSSLGSMVADESRLLYRPDLDGAETPSFSGLSTVFCVNSDAQLSVYLWVYLTICAATEELRPARGLGGLVPEDGERLVALLGAVIAEQVSLERTLEEEELDEAPERDSATGVDGTALRVMLRVAGLVDTLCQRRISKIGKHPRLSTAQLGEIFDEIPETHKKTRLAIAQVLAERSILEGCQEDWRELRDNA